MFTVSILRIELENLLLQNCKNLHVLLNYYSKRQYSFCPIYFIL